MRRLVNTNLSKETAMAMKLIVFDMAGTTVEDKDNVALALQAALQAFHVLAPLPDINLVMGYPKPEAIRELLAQHAEPGATADTTLVDRIHERFVYNILSFYRQSESIRSKDKAEGIFRKLRDMGIKVALDTGFSRDIADAIFERLGWKQGVHFDLSVTSDEVRAGRPFPDMIYKAMADLGIDDVSDVAKVGDTLSDLQEGSSAGCRYVIGVTTGAYTREALSRGPHTHLIERLEEIFEIVGVTEAA